MPPRPPLRPPTVALIALALLALAASAFGPRLVRPQYTESAAGIFFWDNDTVRRLMRLEADDAVDTYPFRNRFDGYPAGTIIHWTLPLDLVIRGLDAALPAIHPQARRYETGAAWSGPLLGALATVLVALLAMRWLGTGPGLVVGLLYSLAVPIHATSQLGNGDHAILHHLALVPAILGFLALCRGDRHQTLLAIGTGIGLGLAMWISTETMVVLAALGVAMFIELTIADPSSLGTRLRHHLIWIGTCLAVCVLGDRLENPGHIAFAWDRLSSFQLLLVGLVATYPIFARLLLSRGASTPRLVPGLAGFASLTIATAAWLGCEPLRTAFGRELAELEAANRWAQHCVREYMPMFVDTLTDSWDGRFATATLTWLWWLLPGFAVAFALSKSIPRPSRAAALTTAAIACGLMCLEVKFAPTFTLLYAPLLVVGGANAIERVVPRPYHRVAQALGAALLVASFAWSLFGFYGDDTPRHRDMALRAHALDAIAAAQSAGPSVGATPNRIGVISQWGLGAHIMYYGHKPAVASAYHRNLAGIRASFEFFATSDLEAAHQILADHQVRWIVRRAEPRFLFQIHDVFPDLPELATLQPIEQDGRRGFRTHLSDEARRSMWVRLDGEVPPDSGFRRIYHSPIETTVLGSVRSPVYQIYEVTR